MFARFLLAKIFSSLGNNRFLLANIFSFLGKNGIEYLFLVLISNKIIFVGHSLIMLSYLNFASENIFLLLKKVILLTNKYFCWHTNIFVGIQMGFHDVPHNFCYR